MTPAPSALLLIATGCQHCPSMLQSLGELVKQGKLSSLEVVNIVAAPERAQALNVRSVPWVKIGNFELVGLKSQSELEKWIDKSTAPGDMSDYFDELMTSGEIAKVQQMIEQQPEHMQSLFNIMQSDQSSLSARIGVGAIIEDLEGSQILIDHINQLGTFCQHQNPRVRNDACYYLGLSHHASARQYIEALLDDENPEVRECAVDALEEIND